ncbi:beta-lactamase-like protein [Xylogone sp. PMI_703]|nr:beta-lactamase-like protein [Xylogone sp. PMI_703]
MSTFKGIVDEFPDIRIDYFRHNPGRRPPLACFLSHVHSDHLAGLESLKSPFIYCSAATKALLLNLESSSHKVNFELGILEARKQHFRHLKKLLKPIPLQTPTNIELGPGNEIRVTLFDANHCTGAVMFLIEGNDKAILYTGDIRSEPWFVNSLVRNPFLVPYAAGIKKLDCMYLDTSNIRPVSFPTKAEGLKELLQKVIRYPKDTVFHLTSWTFGYEEVWMALSQVLNSKIHVDKYKMRLYQSLRKEGSSLGLPQDAPVLAGYTCGNNFQPGCLTDNCNVRIHSCEKELNCSALKNKSIVWIRPIVTRSPEGEEVEEIGIGGGLGDLTKRSRLEQIDLRTIKRLLSSKDTDKSSIEDLNKLGWYSRHSPKIPVSLASLGLDSGEEICLHDFVTRFVSQSAKEKAGSTIGGIALEEIASSAYMGLPKVITFPYSRHASYEELCHLVRELNPRDIYPCTVNEANWHEGGYQPCPIYTYLPLKPSLPFLGNYRLTF